MHRLWVFYIFLYLDGLYCLYKIMHEMFMVRCNWFYPVEINVPFISGDVRMMPNWQSVMNEYEDRRISSSY